MSTNWMSERKLLVDHPELQANTWVVAMIARSVPDERWDVLLEHPEHEVRIARRGAILRREGFGHPIDVRVERLIGLEV